MMSSFRNLPLGGITTYHKVTSNSTPLKARQSLSLGQLKCRVRSVKVSTNDFWDFRKSSYKEVFMVFFLHYLNEEKRGAQNQRYRKTIHEKWSHILQTILYIKRYPPQHLRKCDAETSYNLAFNIWHQKNSRDFHRFRSLKCRFSGI